MTNKQRMKLFQMKHTLSNVVKDNIIDCMQLGGHIRQTVRDTANCATVARFAFAIHSSIRLTVLIPTVETIQQKLKE